jgi:hypothetical protein
MYTRKTLRKKYLKEHPLRRLPGGWFGLIVDPPGGREAALSRLSWIQPSTPRMDLPWSRP